MILRNTKSISSKRLLQLKRNTGGEKYVTWRTTVLERDNYRCQSSLCSKTENLQVQHIFTFSKYPHLRFNTLNGITLCDTCHRKTFGRESVFSHTYAAKALLNHQIYIKNKNEN